MTVPNVASVARTRLSLILLFSVFAAPVFLAWMVFYVFPDWRPSGASNHGELVEPLRPLPAFQLGTLSGEAIDETFLRGKWTLVYLHGGSCAKPCIQQLYQIRQARLAQGKNIDRLQRLMFWIPQNADASDMKELASHFPGVVIVPLANAQPAELVAPFALDAQSAVAAERVYLVDPLGNLMMYYEADADPHGMVEDLEKLLKWSGLG
ncbi:MAG: hypothetical protein RQ736_14715 [Thiogranum sp.]|nr:hypothetical protein [Thiogranum sp.]